MESKFSIVILKRMKVVDDTEICTTIKPPLEYFKRIHPSYLVANMYPEDAVTYAEPDDDEDDEEMDEWEIADIDEDKLLGYNVRFPVVVESARVYCLVFHMPDYVFPLAYGEFKKQLEIFRDSLDPSSVACRLSLMANTEKNKKLKYKNIESLMNNYLVDREMVMIEKELLRQHNEDLKYIKENSDIIQEEDVNE
jgi:hypothetical protein